MYVSSHVWRTFSCTCILCKWWCTLLYSTVYTVYLYSKPRMSGSKQQHSSVIAGPAKKPQKLAVQRKDKETRGRGKGRTKEVHSAGNGKGIFFIWGGVVSFCGTGPKHTTVREGCSSHSGATQCSRVIYEEKKRATTWTSLDIIFFFFKRVDQIEFSKEPNPVPATSGVSEIAACPPSPVADGASAPSSPSSSLSSVSASPCLFTRC